jgi:predicted nucleic acid-binding protein
VASQYLEAMQQLLLIPFEQDAAIRFANLRAENPALSPPDAIQLACAMTERCQLFITNDNRLTSVTGMTNLKVQSLTDWMNNPS